jgi:hypothetical protein
MRFIWWNIAIATWLLFSAFLFSQTPASSFVTGLMSVAVVAFAIAAGGEPAAPYAISALMVGLGVCALLLPGMSGAARLNLAIVAALLFALSLVSPLHAHPGHPAEPASR